MANTVLTLPADIRLATPAGERTGVTALVSGRLLAAEAGRVLS